MVGERPEQIAVLDPGELALPDGVATVVPVRDSMMLATLLARASLVIAPDSAVLHLATLLGVPAIGLYGPTTPAMCRLPGAQLAPLCHTEFPCHPCVDDICEERHCLRALTPAEVSAAVARMLYARDETPDETLVVPASDAVI